MKKWIIALVVVLLLGAAGVWYVFFKPHRDYAGEKAVYDLRASEVIDEYQADEKAADSLYLNQMVNMKGRITSKEEGALTLNEVVYCQLDSTITLAAEIQEGDSLTLKGRILGYDELFSQVRMDHCRPVE
jgi:hypothetical protein